MGVDTAFLDKMWEECHHIIRPSSPSLYFLPQQRYHHLKTTLTFLFLTLRCSLLLADDLLTGLTPEDEMEAQCGLNGAGYRAWSQGEGSLIKLGTVHVLLKVSLAVHSQIATLLL